MYILNFQEYYEFCNILTSESQEKLEEFEGIKLNFVIKHIKFSIFRKGEDIMYFNYDKNAIADFEFVKAFYLRTKNIINEEDFQNTIFNLELEDVDEERLCRSGLMEYKNSRLCISQFGIDTVEHFSIVCDKCGEIIFLNIFSPKNTCPKCGKIITPEYESTLCKDASFRGYRNTMI